MKIRMRVLSAGPEGIKLPDCVYEVQSAEGRDLIAGGYADPIDFPAPRAASEIEAAVLPPPETAILPAARRNPKSPWGRKKSAGEN